MHYNIHKIESNILVGSYNSNLILGSWSWIDENDPRWDLAIFDLDNLIVL